MRRMFRVLAPRYCAVVFLFAAIIGGGRTPLGDSMAWASQGGAGGDRLNRIDYTFSYDPAKVEVRRDGRSGYTQIRYEGLEPFAPENAPGSPLLPAFHARVLLPPGRKVADLVVLTLDPVRVGGRNIVPIPSGGGDDTDGATEPDPFYYEEHHPYPPTPEILLGDGGYRELAIADVAVLPFAWDPARQELTLYRTVEVSLLLEPRDESDGCPPRLRPGMKFSRGRAEVRWAREHLLNPEDLPEFYPESEEESEGDEDPWEDRAGTHSVTDTTAATGFHPTDRPSLEGSPVRWSS